jgi:hypothetical protein
MFSKIKITGLLLLSFFTLSITAQEISSYIKVGESPKSLDELTTEIKKGLNEKEFSFLGAYKPENKNNFKVLAFTRKDLMITCLNAKDRGALASVIKIGLLKKGTNVIVSYLNPEYIFNAYLKEKATIYKSTLDKISLDLKEALKSVGSDFTEFGGSETAKKLRKYHYMIGMPYFTDPVDLMEFSSFDEGVKTIQNNLKNHKGKTVKVYELIFKDKEIAVFGVGLHGIDGEAAFLPKIGEDHIAAMPYEIILEGKKATMLHGKYRLALHWPELTMGQFMKIMSTPNDIKEQLKALTEK